MDMEKIYHFCAFSDLGMISAAIDCLISKPALSFQLGRRREAV